MQNNEKTTQRLLSFSNVEQQFQKEAQTLLSETKVQQTLQQEKAIWDAAEALQIAPSKLIYGNLLRHSKNMLRKHQPFYSFYVILNFLTELSMLLVLAGCLLCTVRFFTTGNSTESFSAPIPYLYGVVVFGALLFISRLNRYLLRKELYQVQNNNGQAVSSSQKKMNHRRITVLVLTLLVSFFILALLTQKTTTCQIQTNLFSLFMGYVVLMVLSGIHNTLYSSHLLPFLTVGVYLLAKKTPEEIEHTADHYISLSCRQLKENQPKNGQAVQTGNTDAAAKSAVRARLVTHRAYYALAIFICILLLGICIYQLTFAITVALLLFSVVILLIVFILTIAFCAANYLIKRILFYPV